VETELNSIPSNDLLTLEIFTSRVRNWVFAGVLPGWESFHGRSKPFQLLPMAKLIVTVTMRIVG
jgi:hypothetical protein